MTESAVAAAALAAWDAGLCVVRAATDGTKRPLGAWRQWQQQRPDRVQVEQWFAGGHPGMGAICGQVSGGLEMVELEGRAVDAGLPDRIDTAMVDAGLGDLWSTVLDGYCERTPSGGLHILWRCETVEGNLKLATNSDGEVLIETRGEGGWVVLAPSNGATHPTGGRWELLAGAPHSIATITPQQRHQLLEILRSFNHTPPEERAVNGQHTSRHTSLHLPDSSDRPGDEFDQTHSCHDVLQQAGFQRHSEDHKGVHYTRPGKNPRHGSSATVWADDNTCTLFSTNIAGLPAEYADGRHKLTPWRLHVALNHHGNHSEAARHWRTQHPRPPTDNWDFIGTNNTSTDNTPAPSLTKIVAGGDWILDAPEGIPAIWGHDEDVLWAEGESLLIAAPPGVGKTTIALQLIWGRLGLLDQLLGYPITPGRRKVLYLAMDRPRQIQRAMGRLARPEHRDTLNQRLAILPGPPPRDLAKYPEIVTQIAAETDADTVVLDSLKDAAIGLSDDEVGASLNRAMQTAISEGIEVLGLHHQRKGQNGTKPKTLEDLYGSSWIAAGAGSVALLWGQPGDTLVELTHLKQPGAVVGPLKIEHEHHSGNTKLLHGFDLLNFLRRNPQGLTAAHAARSKAGKEPNGNQMASMRNALNRLEAKGLARKDKPQQGWQTEQRWYPVMDDMEWTK